MAGRDAYFGGAISLAVTGDVVVPVLRKVVRLVPTASGHEVRMPDARRLGLGTPKILANRNGSGFSVDVVDNAGGTLFTLADEELAEMLLLEHAHAAGVWRWRILACSNVEAGPPSELFTTLGGSTDGLARAYEYDYTANTWATHGDATIAVGDGPAAGVDGVAYAMQTSSGTGMESYSLQAWAGSTLTASPRAHGDGGGSQVEGADEFVVIGHPTSTTESQKVDRYSVSGNSWISAEATKSTNFRFGSVRSVNGKVWLCGGNVGPFFSPSWDGSTGVVEYDPASLSFTTRGTYLILRALTASFVVNDGVLLVGGKDDGVGTETDRNDEFDSISYAITNRISYVHGATSSAAGGSVLQLFASVCGGTSDKDHATYLSGTWSDKTNHPSVSSSFYIDAYNSSLGVGI